MKAKVCIQCNKPKPTTNFNKTKNDRHLICRSCVRQNRKSTGKCVFCTKPVENNKSLCRKCLDANSQRQRKRNREARLAALQAYGNECVYCGENCEVFLTIDHKNNDGAEHRRSVGRGSTQVYVWLRKNNYPEGFQILCYNCNCAKARIGESELLRILTNLDSFRSKENAKQA